MPARPFPQAAARWPIGPADFRNALLCALAVVVAVALTWPFAESPYNDDWSYSFTVKRLLSTGQLTYNGWASASLIAQAYWGLLWVKAFGFSYTVLRLSTVPLAAAAIFLCYLLARHADLRPRFAAFAALMVGLSPLYLPVACTFMTDAPGLFFILLSMYAFVRAIGSPGAVSAIGWLAFGIAVGFVGGTDRQIVWVAPLVLAPYTAWLRRDSPPILFSCLFGWVLLLGAALLTIRWFNHQPYAIPEFSIRDDLRLALHQKAHYVVNVMAIGLTLLWMILPAMWGLVRGWNPTRALVALVLFIGPVVILPMRPRYAVAPWIGNTLSAGGAMGGAELAGTRPVAMPMFVRISAAVVVLAAACVLMADLLLLLTRPLHAVRSTVRFFLFPPPHAAVIPAMTLFALAYFALLLPRCSTNMVYDRYVIPLMPCAMIPILLGYQNRGQQKLPVWAIVLLGIYALYGIAITQEVTALGRARATAVDWLGAAGVKETQIDAGFELDCQAQLDSTGYINDPRIHLPKGAYNRDGGPTYKLQPLYRLEFNLASDTAPTRFGSVPYFSYLYPFHRAVYIDRYVDPWWLNPRKAATRPKDSYHHFIPPTALPANDE